MATIVEVNGLAPTIGADVWLAPTAVLIGDVRVGDRANIWFGTVLRADYSYVEIGAGSSVQDNAVVHCAEGLPTVIGPDVLVGHGAIVLHPPRVAAPAMVAAGAVIGEGAEIAGQMLAAGVPAREKKQLSGSALQWTDTAVDRYQGLRRQYLTTSREV
jgi:carbonic anhydrase/acetyltransferase-like protein (isoleucine patch superfamily)